MSQSNYIQYLKLSTELKSIQKLPPILNANDYTRYLGYSLENQIENTKQVNSQLTLPLENIIYDIETIHVSSCPQFQICNDTELRKNRRTTPYSGYCRPIRPLTAKQRVKGVYEKPCVCFKN